MDTRLFLICFAIVLAGCGNSSSPAKVRDQYFNIADYFEKEISRLSARQPVVQKTVKKNDQQEKRTLKELDWSVELEAFINSDINKPAWRNSYSADSTGGTLVYRAREDGLRVRALQIERSPQGAVKGIIIERAEKNYLYTSREVLRYYPDSLYSIQRHQKVRTLGTDEFRVSGKFD